jgi:FtsH-binding integral membrane protein
METNNLNYKYDNVIQVDEDAASRRFLGSVFAWMFVAMIISGITTYFFTTDIHYLQLIVDTTNGGLTGFGYFAIFSPILFSLVMNFGFNKLSFPVLIALFIAYSAIIGISLSLIFLVYTASSILSVFIAGTAIFAVMAICGYYTTQDLSKFGALLSYAVVGIIIASIANFFIGGSTLNYLIGVIGSAVFTGLTAYYMQRLKRIGAGVEFGTAETNKLALMGALSLYVTLINLILSLLRLFGRRR